MSLIFCACTAQSSGLENSSSATYYVDQLTTTPSVSTATSETGLAPTLDSMTTLTPSPVNVPDDFFFASANSNCQLPCWNGITIGQSTRSDVSSALEDLYETPRKVSALDNLPDGLDGFFSAWVFGQSPYESFATISVFDEQAGTLQALSLSWLGERFATHLSLQQILKRMGIPSRVLIAYRIGGQGNNHADMQMYLLYDNGVTFFESMGLPIITENKSATENTSVQTIELCINRTDIASSQSIRN